MHSLSNEAGGTVSARAGGALGELSAVCETSEILLDRVARLRTVRAVGGRAHVVDARRVGMFELP